MPRTERSFVKIRSIYFTLYRLKKCKNMQAMGPEVAFLWHEVERQQQAWYGSQRPLSGSIQPSNSLYQRILLTRDSCDAGPGKTLRNIRFYIYTILSLIYCPIAMLVSMLYYSVHTWRLVEFDIT